MYGFHVLGGWSTTCRTSESAECTISFRPPVSPISVSAYPRPPSVIPVVVAVLPAFGAVIIAPTRGIVAATAFGIVAPVTAHILAGITPHPVAATSGILTIIIPPAFTSTIVVIAVVIVGHIADSATHGLPLLGGGSAAGRSVGAGINTAGAVRGKQRAELSALVVQHLLKLRVLRGLRACNEVLTLESGIFGLAVTELFLKVLVGQLVDQLTGSRAFCHDGLLGGAAAIADSRGNGSGALTGLESGVFGRSHDGGVNAGESLTQRLLDTGKTGLFGGVQPGEPLSNGVHQACGVGVVCGHHAGEALTHGEVGAVLTLKSLKTEAVHAGLNAGQRVEHGIGTTAAAAAVTAAGNNHGRITAAGTATAIAAVPAVAEPGTEQGTGERAYSVTPSAIAITAAIAHRHHGNDIAHTHEKILQSFPAAELPPGFGGHRSMYDYVVVSGKSRSSI
nr:MAG TPA: hypothetical protein [Caudoviricetes sp.]